MSKILTFISFVLISLSLQAAPKVYVENADDLQQVCEEKCKPLRGQMNYQGCLTLCLTGQEF